MFLGAFRLLYLSTIYKGFTMIPAKQKKALMFCHRQLVNKGLFFLALGVFRFLQGNQLYISAAVTALRAHANQLNN
jgi:hypothetical protein